MKRLKGIIFFALLLFLSTFAGRNSLCFAANYYLHTTTADNLNNNAPSGTTAKFKDSPAVNRTTYQQIGIWSAAPLSSPYQLESLSDLLTWIGLKNSDDQGTYFDLKVELRKNGIVIASGETKNIQGVTRNASLAKEVAVTFGAISSGQFVVGDVLSIRILVKVADSGGHNNAVGLRLYYDAVSRPSRFGAIFGSPPTKLVVTGVNAGTNPVAGAPFSVTVQSQEASGVPANVAGATGVSLSLKSGTGILGGMLIGTIAAGTNQVAIAGVSYTKAESGVVLTATGSSGDNLSAGDSAPFTINPGAASNVAFITQPGNATAGSVIPGPPTVAVQDSLGNTVISSTVYITVALGANPGGSTLGGNATLYTSGGVATFNDLSLNKVGAGYTLTASSAGLTGATSSAFNINPGAAAALAFTTQPGNTNVGSSIPGPPTITVQDSLGNAVTNTSANITITLGANPGGGVLSGAVTKNAASGVATFNDLSINQPATGYRLTASSTGLSGTTSSPFDINAPSGVTLTATPTSLAAGNPFTVSWAQIAAPTQLDWIGLYTPGSGETSYISYIYVSCTSSPNVVAPSGNCQFATSNYLSAGTYEFRLFTNNSYNRIATSNPVTVTPGLILTANPSSVPAGATVTVTWTNNPNPTSTDWIRIRRVGGFIGERIYVSCTPTPNLPLASGSCPYGVPTSPVPANYFFELLANDTNTVIATSNLVTVLPPSKLAIYASQNPTAGPPGFTMTVESQIATGLRANVLTDTVVTVSLKTGTGILSGPLSATILAGTSQAVIGPATYTKAESGVVVTATRTSGDSLLAADSSPFTVNGGAPVRLVFVTQPGNTTVGSSIPGPPTVVFLDTLDNVTAPTAAVTVALGGNPSGARLDDNLTVTYGSSVSFPALIINQAGNGYTLVAASPGLQSATSNPFNITLPGGGGTIAGVITRVSDSATISGALVEAFEGIALRGTAVTNSSGTYSITGLAAGSYTVRASFTGLVPRMLNDVQVISGNTTNVSLRLNFGIAVQSPVAGATINAFSVLVTGNFDTSLAPEVGIQVNGYIALQDGNEFAALVPFDSQTTTVTATLSDAAGNLLAGDAVPITPQPPASDPVLNFRPSPAIAFVTQAVNLTLTTLNDISQVQLDGNGDGTVDFTGATLDGVSITFAEPGLYFPSITITESGGAVRSATALMQVLDMSQLDLLLTSKWNGMKDALRSGNTAAAADYIVKSKRVNYQNVFNSLTVPFANIDQVLTNITYTGQTGLNVEYEMLRMDGADLISYMVVFVLDEDGVWRIKFF